MHKPGDEYLVANPIEIPALPSWLRDVPKASANDSFTLRFGGVRDQPKNSGEALTAAFSSTKDSFLKCPSELKIMIAAYLPPSDIANLRLVSRAYRELPISLFRGLLFEGMPWLWEARDLSRGETDWYALYLKAKYVWADVKGLKNRKRIWGHVNEIVGRIEVHRREGEIVDLDEKFIMRYPKRDDTSDT